MHQIDLILKGGYRMFIHRERSGDGYLAIAAKRNVLVPEDDMIGFTGFGAGWIDTAVLNVQSKIRAEMPNRFPGILEAAPCGRFSCGRPCVWVDGGNLITCFYDRYAASFEEKYVSMVISSSSGNFKVLQICTGSCFISSWMRVVDFFATSRGWELLRNIPL